MVAQREGSLPLCPQRQKLRTFALGFGANSSAMAHDKRNEDNVETDFFQEAGAVIHGGKMHSVPVLALQTPELKAGCWKGWAAPRPLCARVSCPRRNQEEPGRQNRLNICWARVPACPPRSAPLPQAVLQAPARGKAPGSKGNVREAGPRGALCWRAGKGGEPGFQPCFSLIFLVWKSDGQTFSCRSLPSNFSLLSLSDYFHPLHHPCKAWV